MSYYIKVAAVVGILGLFLGTLYVFHARSDEAGRVMLSSLDSVQEKSEQLDVALEESLRRIANHDALIVALIEGRATLADVAAAFLALHEGQPMYSENLRLTYSGRTDLERAAQDVANRANIGVAIRVADPTTREKLAERLVSEFQTLFPGAQPLQFEPIPVPVPKKPSIPPPLPHPPPIPKAVALPIHR